MFFVITLVPIKIYTCQASQNDHLNLSFEKENHVVGKEMARYGVKMAIYQMHFFRIRRTCTVTKVTSEAITFDPIKIFTSSIPQNDP